MPSGSSRPLAMRARADLIAKRQNYEGRDCWVIKDPIAMKYFRFEEEEYRLLQMMDGQSSPQQIKAQFESQFAPQKITLQELFQLVGMLYRNSLLVSDAPEQGQSLRQRAIETKKAKRWQSLTNVLAIRFRGFDPDDLLTALNPYTAWFFTWPAFVAVMLLGLGALSLIVTNFESFQNKLPSFDNFFAAGNWALLAIVLGVTKVIHEFGHGLACKRFGGRCHEMGLMFLVLTPCLYANVSDSWLLKCKWKRAFIAAAGMYVELVIASIAVFVWWFSIPGLVHHMALNVIVVCSVSTLLFNANPLLRYDGYYILADLLEIPNLRQKSTNMLNRASGRIFLGIESAEDVFAPSRRKWMFVTYSVLAVAYRWLITFSIFWFVYRVLEPYGFKIVGQMLGVMAIYGLVGMPLVKLYKFFSIPGRTSMVKPVRLAGTLAIAAILLVGIMLIPIPRYVYGCFYIQPKDVQTVYVEEPGILSAIYIQPNQFVEEGTPLVQLESPDLDVQLAGLESEVRNAHVELWVAEQAEMNRTVGQMTPVEARSAVATAMSNYDQKHHDHQRLLIRSPRSGFFLAGHRRPAPNSDSGELHGWHGSPLEPRNIGCSMDRQTIVGQVIPDMSKLTAVLAIDQSEIEFVRRDQQVKLVSWQDRTRVLESSTEEISPVEMKVVPRSLSSRFGGDLITRQNADGDDVPMSTTYMVNVPVELASDDAMVFPGSTGVAKIRTGSQTVGARIWRLVCHTFQFEL
jgi:putative peptide zinc metalloprotease protein